VRYKGRAFGANRIPCIVLIAGDLGLVSTSGATPMTLNEQTTLVIIQACLINLTLGLKNIEDLNTERESLSELVNELYHLLVLEA